MGSLTGVSNNGPAEMTTDEWLQSIAKECWAALEPKGRALMGRQTATPPPIVRMEKRMGGTTVVHMSEPWEKPLNIIAISEEFVTAAKARYDSGKHPTSKEAVAFAVASCMGGILAETSFASALYHLGMNAVPADVERAAANRELKPNDPNQPPWAVNPKTNLGKFLLLGMSPKKIRQQADTNAAELTKTFTSTFKDLPAAKKEFWDARFDDPTISKFQRRMRKLDAALYPFRPGSAFDRWFRKVDAVLSRPFRRILNPIENKLFGKFHGKTYEEIFPEARSTWSRVRDRGIQPLNAWRAAQQGRENVEAHLQLPDEPGPATTKESARDWAALDKKSPDVAPAPAPAPASKTTEPASKTTEPLTL